MQIRAGEVGFLQLLALAGPQFGNQPAPKAAFAVNQLQAEPASAIWPPVSFPVVIRPISSGIPPSGCCRQTVEARPRSVFRHQTPAVVPPRRPPCRPCRIFSPSSPARSPAPIRVAGSSCSAGSPVPAENPLRRPKLQSTIIQPLFHMETPFSRRVFLKTSALAASALAAARSAYAIALKIIPMA